MTVQEIVKQLNMTVLCGSDDELQKQVSSGYACDLLSRVMANGQKDSLWITVQSHINVVAIASLHEMACVVIPEKIAVPAETIEKAKQEGIVLLSCEKDTFTIASQLPSLSKV
jgi:predicted transcriptional regulator